MGTTEFIEKIGNAAISKYSKYKILPSLTIAQAILESGWGKSKLSTDCYNYFGMKWTEGCGCDYKEYETKEQRKDGTWYTIKARFRKYKSVADGIDGYYVFLQKPRYENIKGVTDYKKACTLIREDGWATALKYTESLIKLIEQYDLTKYDKKVLNKEIKLNVAKSLNKNIAGTYKIKPKDGAHLREGYSTSTKSLAVLKQNTKVKNYGYYTKYNGYTWYYVKYGTKVGFIRKDLLVKA